MAEQITTCEVCGARLLIIGTTDFDGVHAECSDVECGVSLEVESDGLGFGGLEWVQARMVDDTGEPVYVDEVL